MNPVSDDGTGTVAPVEGKLVYVPPGHGFYLFPITDSTDDDGAQIIDSAAAHHVTDALDNGELTPVGHDGFGAPIYPHQLEPEDG